MKSCNYLLVLGLITFIYLIYFETFSVRYITFDTDLSTLKKRNFTNPSETWTWLPLILLWLFFSDCSYEIQHVWIIHTWPNPTFFLSKVFKLCWLMAFLITISLSVYLLLISPVAHILSLVITFMLCSFITRNVPTWVSLLLILLPNDIELHPGPQYHENCFSFMNWNLNSLANNNFERVQLIEAQNSIFNYDLISLCETSWNESTEIPDPLLNDYTFIPANHPDDVTHGGVGLFYKNSLPIILRNDLAFRESIVVELKFGRKKMFFTVLYRSPSFKHSSVEFTVFISNFKVLHTKIQAENPYASFYTGDFNGHSQFWWPDGDSTPEGKEIEEIFSLLNLSQIISEPINFTPGKKPSCIDLIVTDQSNLILDSGSRQSLVTVITK